MHADTADWRCLARLAMHEWHTCTVKLRLTLPDNDKVCAHVAKTVCYLMHCNGGCLPGLRHVERSTSGGPKCAKRDIRYPDLSCCAQDQPNKLLFNDEC